jgi:hypothetical protein
VEKGTVTVRPTGTWHKWESFNKLDHLIEALPISPPSYYSGLKPLLRRRSFAVPMLVVFLGAIGGFIFSGLIGLFTGAVVLSVGYNLMVYRLGEGGN